MFPLWKTKVFEKTFVFFIFFTGSVFYVNFVKQVFVLVIKIAKLDK